ncbi:MAG TPA: hypothetical protein VGR22_10335 [Thermomicrobiales bacterium]|nr:hypothetical protein [Thermomicrobiales bacterium]
MDELFQRRRHHHLSMSFSNIALGLWLLSSPALFDYQNTALARSEALNGVAVMVLGILAPSKCGDGIDCARIAYIGRHSGGC